MKRQEGIGRGWVYDRLGRRKISSGVGMLEWGVSSCSQTNERTFIRSNGKTCSSPHMYVYVCVLVFIFSSLL